MILLEESLGGLSAAVVFQIHELLSSYRMVYGKGDDEGTLGFAKLYAVALALALKLRESKFARMPKQLFGLEMQMFAAAMRTNAFTTLHDQVICKTAEDDYINCCCESALFGPARTVEEIIAQASEWRAGNAPIGIDPRIVQKYGLSKTITRQD